MKLLLLGIALLSVLLLVIWRLKPKPALSVVDVKGKVQNKDAEGLLEGNEDAMFDVEEDQQPKSALGASGPVKMKRCVKKWPRWKHAEGHPKWTAQILQDWLVIQLCRNRKYGFYVDLAAHTPVYLSNTFALERWFEWFGLCIEALPKHITNLKRKRKCRVIQAIVDSERHQVDYNFDNSTFSGIVSADTDVKRGEFTKTVQTQTLTDLLTENCAPTTIEYLSLDVEGAEFRIMRNFSFSKFKFLIITIERPIPDLCHLLQTNGYRFMGYIGKFGETLWLHRTFYDANVAFVSSVMKAYRLKLAKQRMGRKVPWVVIEYFRDQRCNYSAPKKQIVHGVGA